MRRIGGCLIKISTVFFQRTIDLIRRHMKEFFVRLKGSVRKLPCSFCSIQHNKSSKYVCFYKNFRITDTSVHMAFCCKVNNPVNVIFFKNLHDFFAVTDIRFHKRIIISVFNILEIFKVPRISQFVYVNNADFIVILLKHIVNIVGTDKTCSSCYQICSHIFFLLVRGHCRTLFSTGFATASFLLISYSLDL